MGLTHERINQHGIFAVAQCIRVQAEVHIDAIGGKRDLRRSVRGDDLLIGMPEALERQLSHKEPGVDNKAQHLPERRKIMQEWADYLVMLKSSGVATASGVKV